MAATAMTSPVGRRTIPVREIRIPHSCPRPARLSVLAGSEWFGCLDGQELAEVESLMIRRAWTAGDRLFHAGDEADALFMVARGRVKLQQVRPDGSEVVTDVLAPGEVCGALGILARPFQRHTAEALVDTCTLGIRQSDLRRVLTEHPQVALHVIDQVSARLARAESLIGAQATRTVPARLATTLLRLAAKLGRERGAQGVLLEVPLSRADLAGLARSTPESVSRVLSRWKEEGLIDSGRRWVSLLDRACLERIAREQEI